MTSEETRKTCLPGASELEFRHTVDRSLLHRWALAEVFLTDGRRVSDNEYLAAAQLPPSHAYYTDHISRLGAPDPMLLLECCRQAETYGGHEYAGVSRDSKFLLRSWSMALPGLLSVPQEETPGELRIAVRLSNRRGAPGDARRLTFGVDMKLAGRCLGFVSMDVGYIPSEVYDAVRLSGRGRPLVPFRDIPRQDAHVAPHLVGRNSPSNVVLSSATLGTDSAQATVRIPLDNRSMFDHGQDHVPGMVLMEAARQLCLLGASDLWGASAHRTTVAGFDFSFMRYAELDLPTTVHIRKTEPYVPEDNLSLMLPDLRTFYIDFEQQGDVIASGRMHTTTSAATRPLPVGEECA
ncbi:gamma-butyrolactone biosynthesis protein [Streptomyces sp. 3MP-14]|uniref:Gamma-butyrolactone biosynthesis protein n=1 Tax=Streptomyces mimosae TaxID=2586635 RepID=A0A5N6A2Z2_9ACTN|nr:MULTISPECIES: AfsA-related hotdog domain-containing protein [Streptomyces]KAB8162286.1 gamma-butyrolactone biosynthesis protein [Streptomyces mimosae]KAB8173815.1 gamma-butyrolactone biosynthesis protein [Streptomyces sp. 3MP-14]